MKSISNYKKETLLSFSFLLDRITPAALYFLPILIISYSGNSFQISTYSVFSSIFTSFVAIPLGFTTAVRYYSSLGKIDEKNDYSAGSALVFTVCVSIVSVFAYVIFYYYVFKSQGFDNANLLLLFAIAILLVAPYYSITSMNEGKKDVKINNLCGFLSVPLILILILMLNLEFDIVLSCALAFVLTRLVMLALIVFGYRDKGDFLKISYLAIYKTAKYGLAISILFFVQKLVSTLTISGLSADKNEVSAFQLITVYALLISLASNAIFTNVFIGLTKKDEGLRFTFFTSLLNMLITMVSTTALTWWFVINQIDVYLKDEYVVSIIKTNLNLLLYYLIFEGLMTASIIISRACGDTWRCQSLWCVCVLLMLAFNSNPLDLQFSLSVFIAADCLCIFMCVYISHKYLASNKLNHI